MPKLQKLMLVRKASVRSTLLDRMGATKFLNGEPFPVSPKTWADENGESHYGYLLKDLSIKDIKEIEAWLLKNDENGDITLHIFDPGAKEPDTKESVLESLGLRINEAVE